MSFEIKRLKEERAKLVADWRAMLESAEKEDRGLSEEEKANSDRAESDIQVFDERVARLERVEEAAKQLVPDTRPDEPTVGEITEETRSLALQGWMRAQCDLALTDHHRQAMEVTAMPMNRRTIDLRMRNTSDLRALREGRAGMSTTDNVGGYTIPTGFVNNFEIALLAFGGPRQVADVIRTDSGNDLPWPTANDTGNTGVLLAEETTIGTTVNPTVSIKTFYAYKMSSKLIQISPELLQDSAFDMAAEIGRMLGERIGRCECTYYTTGTGSSQPSGCVTGATAGNTTASATAITADEIIDLIHTIDASYRQGAAFMMHDTVLSYIRKLKDGNGVYLWQPGMTFGKPDMIFGYPVYINTAMSSTITATDKTMMFGQWSKFKIRDVAQIRLRRLVERYADTDQEGFVAFHRTDSGLLDAGTHPLKYLLQHA